MAEQKPTTPERQLLKLIEEPQAAGSLRTAKIKHRGLSFISPGAWLGRISYLKVKAKGWFRPQAVWQLDIKSANNVLWVAVAVFSIYFVGNFSASLVNLKNMPNLKANLKEANAAKAFQGNSLLKAPAYYLEIARKRDIFKIGAKPVAVNQTIKTPSARLIEATQSLRLVGISWSDDPDVMIEDTKYKKTLFLKRGQMIDSNVKLQAVFKDKVVLSLDGEELELK
jgi:hypothetical protein